ncbi:hypothetical protein C497_00890 [Halalkalicoccus jeotgali B3]|uniref:JAB domain-containing protein n=1 Tax=Halalkalicoccus jeotgali (strain DSM 18796 / CECT 7217 / JCM 14584 / KCTC 4019 / B3) TaxID=795797 RepID=D8JBH4_HALJB|nr:hypothetical protein HacjB3_16356 [Halalkalicoccus jeotgali B3]ELY41276.1 hypothetical protein C497_00890 [Halalkalicoccus jeotgali B3]
MIPPLRPLVFPQPVRGIVIPAEIRHAIESHVAAVHPKEAGGFLACTRQGDRLHAKRHVSLPNDAPMPRRRFSAVVDDRVPPPPRVFYHSHTSARSPSGHTRTDERSIPEPFSIVVFAPHGPILSYRAFKRRLFDWRELLIESKTGGGRFPRQL